jgi:hypothetical protein
VINNINNLRLLGVKPRLYVHIFIKLINNNLRIYINKCLINGSIIIFFF